MSSVDESHDAPECEVSRGLTSKVCEGLSDIDSLGELTAGAATAAGVTVCTPCVYLSYCCCHCCCCHMPGEQGGTVQLLLLPYAPANIRGDKLSVQLCEVCVRGAAVVV